jgi:hypothetical protein
LLLISSDKVPGLDAAQLLKFKALYSPYAFTCRFPACSTGIIGFSTKDARAQHEKSHAPPLLCTHAGCTYTLPFKSLHGLRRHVREYHTVKDIRIPKSIRLSSGRSESRPNFQNRFHRPGASPHTETNSPTPWIQASGRIPLNTSNDTIFGEPLYNEPIELDNYHTENTPPRSSNTLRVSDPFDLAHPTGPNAYFDLYGGNSVTNDASYNHPDPIAANGRLSNDSCPEPPQPADVMLKREQIELNHFCVSVVQVLLSYVVCFSRIC